MTSGRLPTTKVPLSNDEEEVGLRHGAASNASTSGNLAEKVDELFRENERLRKQLQHVDSLGRMMADCKQSNVLLSRENSNLQEKVDELMRLNHYWSQQLNGQPKKFKLSQSGHSASMAIDSNGLEPEERDQSSDEESVDHDRYDEALEIVDAKKYSLPDDDQTRNGTTCVMTSSDSTEDLVKTSFDGPTSTGPVLSNSNTTQEFRQNNTESGSSPKTIKTSRKSSCPEKHFGFAGENDPQSNRNVLNEEDKKSQTTVTEATAAAAFCERQAKNFGNSSLSMDVDVYNEVVKSGNSVTPSELRQLEDMVGIAAIGSVGGADEDGNLYCVEENEKSSSSVTDQFAKLATVFARLAQRVLQTQRKARNSQAFCDALMRENVKLKMSLSTEEKKVTSLQRQMETRDQESKLAGGELAARKDKSQSRRNSSLTEETNVKEGQDTTPDDVSSSANTRNSMAKLQNRVKKLEAQRAEILTVNKQWHSQYNKLKEDNEGKLASSKIEIGELKEQISGKQKENAKRRKDIDLLLREAKKEIEILQRQKGDLAKNYALEHGKTQDLMEKIQKLKSDFSCVQAENQRLNQALEAAYSIRQNRLTSFANLSYAEEHVSNANEIQSVERRLCVHSEEEMPDADHRTQAMATTSGEVEDLRTRIEVLQEQVKIYREDFETERRDREKSQAEKQRLSEQMVRMRDEMRALTQQVRAHEQDFRQERREKQRMQRQLSRMQLQAAVQAPDRGGEFYYDVDVADFARPLRPRSPTRDRRRNELGEMLIQTTTPAVDANRRYTARTRTNPPPPPYTNDSSRHRRRPATTNRRIHDGYLDPVRYDQDPEVAYPPDNLANQY